MPDNAVIGALSYVKLEEVLLEDFRRLPTPSAHTVWVIVPTNVVALHLQRRLAQETEGLMGVRFLRMQDAAAELAAPELARNGTRPMPRGATELVLEKALAELPEEAYFAEFRDFPGSVRAISRALDLLEHALWTPDTLRQAAPGSGVPELALLWEKLQEFCRQHRFHTAADMFRRADAGSAVERPDTLLLYGLYDLTPLQRRLVEELARPSELFRAYLLWEEDEAGEPLPGFDYAAPTVRFLSDLAGTDTIRCVGDVENDSDLGHLRRDVFRADIEDHPHETDSLPLFDGPDGSVEIVNCPGDAGEAEELARETLRRFRRAHPPRSLAVLTRTATDLAEDLAESMDRADLPCYMNEGRPLTRTVPGRIVTQVLDLADGPAERDAVIQLLSIARVDWPEELSVTALDRISRLAGVVEGWDAWRTRLRNWAAEQENPDRRDGNGLSPETARRQARLARAAAEFMDGFLPRVRRLAAPSCWTELSADLSEFLHNCLPLGEEGHPPEGRREVLEAAEQLAELDVTGVPPSVGRASRLLQQSLNAQSRRAAKFQESRITFGSIMRSRGTTHEVVLLPRMIEKSFPRRIPAAPLLADRERIQLNETAVELGCGALPLQRHRPREERYLFRVALGSARNALVMSWPRIEQDSGKPRIPSRYLEQTCETLLDRRVSAEEISDATLGRLTRRVATGPLQIPEEGLDAWEHDLAVHIGAEEEVAASYTGSLCSTFQRAIRMDNLRWADTDFGPYDGKVRREDLLTTLADHHGLFCHAVSPSRLETYAGCPFHYFLQYVLGVEELEKPGAESEIPALEWGNLLHKLYCRLYRKHLRGVALGELTDGRIDDLVEAAAEILDDVGGEHADARPATWQAARRQALEQLRQALRAERDENAGARPEHFEFRFGETDGTELRLGPDPETSVSVRGRIDRVDGLAGGGAQVIDYKSGSSRRYRKDSFEGGTQVQLPLYLLAVAAQRRAQSGRARYFFVTEPDFTSEFTLQDLEERRGDLEKIVRLVVDGVRSGNFFVLPRETTGSRSRRCSEYCSYGPVCGAARDKLAEIKYEAGTDPDLAHLLELWGIE